MLKTRNPNRRIHSVGPQLGSRKRKLQPSPLTPGNTRKTGTGVVEFGGMTVRLPLSKSHSCRQTDGTATGSEIDHDDDGPEDSVERKRRRQSESHSPYRSRASASRASDSVEDDPTPPAPRVEPAHFLDQLIVNIERFHILRRCESATGSQQSHDQLEMRARRLRLACRKQHARVARLYHLAEDPDTNPEIRDDEYFQRMGPRFLAVLKGNMREHQRLLAHETNVDGYRWDMDEIHDHLDGAIRARAKLELDVSREKIAELAGMFNKLERLHLAIEESETNFVRSRQDLERLYDSQRKREWELYRLAQPVLLEEGLLDEKAVESNDRGATLWPSGPSSPDPKTVKPAENQSNTKGTEEEAGGQQTTSGEQRKQGLRTVTQTVREALLKEYIAAQEGLSKARAELERSRGRNKQLEVNFEDELKKRKMTGTKEDYDKYMYLRGRDAAADIREAEARFEYAKDRAREVGVLPAGQTSGFGRYAEDRTDEADSDVQKKLIRYDAGPVEAWRGFVNGVPKDQLADPNVSLAASEEPELEPFAAKELELGASLSTLAAGKQRAKLEQYSAGPRPAGWAPANGFCNDKGLWE